ncbi:MAG: hypothetical protein DWQ44_07015 [Bacteroidetes bacterium]|nr:MAG: hypothetical protein DWQ33_12675 [Bacteroidota bacterium]REJ99766.1 MAG: hypothetical protein DWQ39_12635 [Bacteroidota bacterium]REK34139.1 MAG: hypothetical protein DWQ44_07015 [Bacteroidota bacterium]REK50469.1 MAG: hypothetical protein DWQ48_03925 [Bacteroidota bacterium]
MNKTTTREDLLLYAYNDCGLADSDRIQKAVDGDPIIQSDFNEICQVLDLLNHSVQEPSQECIDRIMKYSLNR